MKRTRLTACLLAGVLCLGLLPGSVFAVEPEAEPPRLRSNAFNFMKGSKASVSLQEELPSCFDLRHVQTAGGEVSYVTPVKVQNPFGTCWGFAAVAAAESSLLSSGLAEELGYDVNTLDLSEKHIAYFANTYIDDPNDPQYKEGAHFETIPKGEESTQAYKYDTGGMTCMVTGLFAAGIGPVLEKYYTTDSETGDPVLVEDPLWAYRGKRGEVAYWEAALEYDADNKPVESSYRSVPVWYSNQDDWSIPSEQRFAQDFRLKESIVLPDPAGYPWDPETETYKYVYQPEAVGAIKEQLVVHHRAVCVSFCAESYLPGQDTTGKKYMSKNWAHFTNDSDEYSNHAVTVVGYDDNYPRENFSSTTEKGNPAQPEGDGAFLIKNSWDSELNDFPNNGYRHWGLLDGQDGVPYDKTATPKPGMRATGYFWISYYDRSMNDPEAFVFEPVTSENTCYLEQMDFMDPMYVLYQGTEEEGRMANVFTAEATARLSEISFMTTVPGTTVSYAVYLLGEGYEDPEDDILIETGETEPFEYGGYHRIKLQSPTVLAKGQQYSVVIGESVVFEEPSEIFYYIPYTAAYNHGANLYYVGVINEGESFFNNGTGWGDLSEPETRAEVTAYYPGYDLTLDNFPIKSYLEPITYPAGSGKVFPGYISVNNWQDGNPGTFTVTNGATKTLTAEFRGLGMDIPAGWDPSFTWVPVDETRLSVTTSTPKKGSAVITGLKPGVTQLLVYAGDGTEAGAGCYGIRVLTIRVEPDPWPDDTCVYSVENVTVNDSPACTAVIFNMEDDSVTACAARYEAGGRFLGMRMKELESGEMSEFTVPYNGAGSVRFFVVDGSFAPVCDSVTAWAD